MAALYHKISKSKDRSAKFGLRLGEALQTLRSVMSCERF